MKYCVKCMDCSEKCRRRKLKEIETRLESPCIQFYSLSYYFVLISSPTILVSVFKTFYSCSLLFCRFGITQFFEHPLTNPYGHEERFILSVEDPELRLVTGFDEWLHLRQHCKVCVGDLGSEPVEAEMFD